MKNLKVKARKKSKSHGKGRKKYNAGAYAKMRTKVFGLAAKEQAGNA